MTLSAARLHAMVQPRTVPPEVLAGLTPDLHPSEAAGRVCPPDVPTRGRGVAYTAVGLGLLAISTIVAMLYVLASPWWIAGLVLAGAAVLMGLIGLSRRFAKIRGTSKTGITLGLIAMAGALLAKLLSLPPF